MTNKKFKIPPKKIDSSDCVVHIGQRIQEGKIVEEGESFAVHENEWVKIIPVTTMGESLALMNITSIDTETGANAQKSFDVLCESLSKRVVDWNWTGIDNELMPKPYKNPQVFKDLQNEELIWLVSASVGETPGEQKNESKDSLNTQSAEVKSNLPSR
jgi:hypothetical protein